MTITAPVPTIPAGSNQADSRPPRLRYGALITMMLMSFFFVTAEFLPSGMLTRIADGLDDSITNLHESSRQATMAGT